MVDAAAALEHSVPAQPPLPDTISGAARAQLSAMMQPPATTDLPLEQMRAFADAVQARLSTALRLKHAVEVEDGDLGGVPVRLFTPADGTAGGPLLLNFHGGGFTVDSGSLTENIPLAARSGVRVAAVLYRLAPEHPYPAAVEDALTAYRAALQDRSPAEVAVFGTSAGAVLVGQLLAGLAGGGGPMPAAAGVFSGSADLARTGDSEGFLPRMMDRSMNELLADYLGSADRRDPRVSPLYGDLSRFPPTLLMTSTRDQLLSQTTILHRALLRAGVPAELVVFEALTHAFWSYLDAPETDEAFETMAQFFRRRLGLT